MVNKQFSPIFESIFISPKSMNNKHIPLKITVFHGKQAPEKTVLACYGAIRETYNLAVPIPNQLALGNYFTNQKQL